MKTNPIAAAKDSPAKPTSLTERDERLKKERALIGESGEVTDGRIASKHPTHNKAPKR